MAAKKISREQMVNFIKSNVGSYIPRSKADKSKFDNFEKAEDKVLVQLYRTLQGSLRRLAARQGATTENTSKVKNTNKGKKNDIFKKFGFDKSADLETLQAYHKDATALLDAVTARIKANKENRKVELEKDIAKLQKELAKIG